MAQLDKIHDAVKNALIKDGWTITAENYQIRFKELKFYGDIEAEKIFAVKGTKKILVEVKSFIGVSVISEFQKALGQFRIYQDILSELKPEIKVFLAFSEAVYNKFFVGEGIKFIIEKEQLAFFVVDLKNEVILQWKT